MSIKNKTIHRETSNGARIWQRAFEAAAKIKLERDVVLLIKEVDQLDDSCLYGQDAMEPMRESVGLN